VLRLFRSKKAISILLVVLLVNICSSLFFRDGELAYADTATKDTSSVFQKAYVTSYTTGVVDVVDLKNLTVEKAKIKVGNTPNSAAINPNKTQVFVTNRGDGTVSIIDPLTDTVISTIKVGVWPHGVTFNADGSKAYVANLSSNSLSVIDTATLTVTNTITVKNNPVAMVVAQGQLYVTEDGGNGVIVVDVKSDTIISDIQLPGKPFGLSTNSQGTKIYVADRTNNSVDVIDTASNTLEAIIPNVHYPYSTEVSPDGTKVYVVNTFNSTVTVINSVTNKVETTIPVGSYPYVIGLSQEGSQAFTVNYSSNDMSVIDTSTNKVINTIPLSTGPFMVGTFMISVATAMNTNPGNGGGSTDTEAPTVTAYTPVKDAQNVAVNSELTLTFNEVVKAVTGKTITIRKTSDDSVVETIGVNDATAIKVSEGKVTIKPTASLDNGTGYYVLIEEGAFQDESSNLFAGIADKTIWNFTTEPASEKTDLTVTAYHPIKGSTNAGADTKLKLIFSSAVQAEWGKKIEIRKKSDDSVVYSFETGDMGVEVSGNTVTFNSILQPSTEYYVLVADGAFKDDAGNKYAGITDKETWTFTTKPKPDTDTDTDADLNNDYDSLDVIYGDGDYAKHITKKIGLLEQGISGNTTITWESSHPNVVSTTGEIVQPGSAEGDIEVTLTATILDRNTGEKRTKVFKLTVISMSVSDEDAVRAATKALGVDKAFQFSDEDTWESVTNEFMLLGMGIHGTNISWTSSNTDVIKLSNSNGEASGAVNRPEVGDKNVIVTATISKGSAKMTKSFLLVVTNKNVVKDKDNTRQETGRTADVKANPKDAVQRESLSILRTTLNNHVKIDTVIIDPLKVESLTDKINPQEGNILKRTLTVEIKQQADDKADEIAIEIPAAALSAMADRNVSMDILTDEGSVKLSQEALKDAAAKGTDLYFRIVPVKNVLEEHEVKQAVNNDLKVTLAASGNQVNLLGLPRKIETNFGGFTTKVVLPLSGITIPAENGQAFLNALKVYIEHTDGTTELVSGTIQYENNVATGIEFEITKFSRFQIIGFTAKPNQENPSGGTNNTNNNTNHNPTDKEQPERNSNAAHTGYILGYTDGSFSPERMITRAEMATILARVWGKNEMQASSSYIDVNASNWAMQSIRTVTAQGLMKGYTDGSFKPNKLITRAEMATIVERLLDSASSDNSSFKDVNVGHWAKNAIDQAKAAGVINGYLDGTFRPNQTLTRAEAVVMINRLLGRGPLLGAQQKWRDVRDQHWAYGHIQEASMDHSYETQPSNGEKYVPGV
jgi:YVTN family beta-propeller protein